MTACSRRRRPGVTLMEVLIATFILSVGLIALMALFPIGAVNMARSINQDRSATHGVNSDAIVRYYWKQAWNDPTTGTSRPSAGEAYWYSQEPMLFCLQGHPSYGLIPPEASQPSFPVLVDPVGFLTNSGNPATQNFVGGNPALPMRTTLRRCVANTFPVPGNTTAQVPGYSTSNFSLAPYPAPTGWQDPPTPYASLIPAVVRLTTLQDDMSFTKPADGSVLAVNGEPTDASGQLDRGGRYNSAWLLQRVRNDVPSEVNVHVLVYAGRSPTDTASAEIEYPGAVAAAGQKAILIPLPVGATTPAIRRGGWVAFAHAVTQTPPSPAAPQGTPLAPPLGAPYPAFDFYRVASVNTDIPNTVVVELEQPIKRAGPTDPNGNYTGSALVFDNLVEVFDRGTVSATGVTGR